MIPVLRSIDSLLNRFDELSQRHASFVSTFDTNFSNIENPLHDVTRDENERRKTEESLLRTATTDSDQLGSFATLEDFNRRITKSRNQHRPPSYSSNDSSSFYHRVPSRSSFGTTESVQPIQISTVPMTQRIINQNNSQQIPSRTSSNDLIEPKSRLTTRIKPKIPRQNPPTIQRNARSAITTFTMETAIRLSRPKTCHYLPEPTVSPKRVHRRPKLFRATKKEVAESSITSIPMSVSSPPPSPPPVVPQAASPQIKRTNRTIIKSSPKRHKTDNRSMTDNSKRIPMSNYPRPTILLVPPPTICLTFPMQPELKSSRVVVIPKANPVIPISSKKTINIFTNKKPIISPNRMMYLMT